MPRAGAEREGQGVSHQAALTSRQRAATGPFLAYVNLCKPLLQVTDRKTAEDHTSTVPFRQRGQT